jgi:hypothetical protein
MESIWNEESIWNPYGPFQDYFSYNHNIDFIRTFRTTYVIVFVSYNTTFVFTYFGLISTKDNYTSSSFASLHVASSLWHHGVDVSSCGGCIFMSCCHRCVVVFSLCVLVSSCRLLVAWWRPCGVLVVHMVVLPSSCCRCLALPRRPSWWPGLRHPSLCGVMAVVAPVLQWECLLD